MLWRHPARLCSDIFSQVHRLSNVYDVQFMLSVSLMHIIDEFDPVLVESLACRCVCWRSSAAGTGYNGRFITPLTFSSSAL